MKYIFLIATILIFNPPAFSQPAVLTACEPAYYKVLQNGSGEYKCYGENGILMQEGYFKEKKAEGTFKTYYLNGNLRAVHNYVNGIRDGVYTDYYEERQLKTTGRYTNDYKEGEWKEYYPSGKLFQIEQYKSGLKEGYVVGYHENDSLMFTGQYADGSEIGEWISYYENGNVLMKRSYATDKSGNYRPDGPYVEYYENKQIKMSGQFDSKISNLDNKQVGTWIEYYPNGDTKNNRSYNGGRLYGPYIEYYENNQIKVTGSYALDDPYGWPTSVPVDVWNYYHPNGKLAIKYVYAEIHRLLKEKEARILNVYQYDEQGKKLDTGTFKNGDGLLKILDENGNLQQEIVMEDGYPKEN